MITEQDLEKYASDDALAKEFMQGMIEALEKEAAERMPASELKPGSRTEAQQELDIMRLQNEQFPGAMFKGFAEALGKGVGGLMITGGMAGLGIAAKSIAQAGLRTKFLKALEHVAKTNSVVRDDIREHGKEKAMQYAETIFKFAPHVASDPNLLSSVLANAIHGQGIDPMTIKTLVGLDGEYTHNNTFTPKTYI